MSGRSLVPIAAIAIAVALVTAGVTFMELKRHRVAIGGRPASASVGTAEEDDASELRDFAAHRTPDVERPPPPAGSVRYRVRVVRTDGKPHDEFVTEAQPEGVADRQTLEFGKGGEATVDAPAACRAIDFTSRGFLPVRHAIAQREIEQADLGKIVFEQAATLEVAIVHAPRNDKVWLNVAAWVTVPMPRTWGGSLGFGGAQLATPDGSAHATLFVPSAMELHLGLFGDAVRIERTLAPLPDGATPFQFDFAQLPSLSGRIVGLPLACLQGATVDLQRFTPKMNGLLPTRDATTLVDASGHFRFAALSDDPFTLRLEGIALRETDGEHRGWWRSDAVARELELEPVEPLLGVEVAPLDDSDRSGPYSSLRIEGANPGYAALRIAKDSNLGRGLARSAALDGATRLVLWLQRTGGDDVRELVVPADRLSPPHDSLVEVRLDRLTRPTASLTVSLPILASRGWTLLLVKKGQRPHSTSEPISATRKRGLFSFTFTDLEAGSYDVYAEPRESFFDHCVASGIALAEGERLEIDADPPKLESINGCITNWNDVPTEIRPREIHLESATEIVDGRFTITAVRPVAGPARFSGRTGLDLPVTADVTTLADGTLAVAFPANELEVFELQVVPAADSLLDAVLPPTKCPDTIDAMTYCPRVGPDAQGTIRIVRKRGELVHGWITECSRGRDWRILGWFSSDVPSGTFAPDGRYVTVENGADGTIATLFLVPRPVGGWQPPRLALCRVISTLSREIWLPAGAEFIDVEFPGHPRDRVPTSSIGDRWTIAPK